MELDWYTDKLKADAVLTPSSSFRWMSPSSGETDRSGSSRWLALLSLERRRLLRAYSSGDEYASRGSSASSPTSPWKSRGDRCRRSLSENFTRCRGDSPASMSPSSSKSHICFGCVLHSHDEHTDPHFQEEDI